MEERARRKREREASTDVTASDKYTVSGKLRKKYTKRVMGESSSTSEAVMASRAKVKGASKKINYDALKVGMNPSVSLCVDSFW
jgi:hypothetical protein